MSKLVYVASTGHSGSTLLDMVIGSIPRIFSAGEIKYLPWQIDLRGKSEASVKNLNVCTCLKTFDECDVWSKIIHELIKKKGFNIFTDPYHFNLSIFGAQTLTQKPNLFPRICGALISRSIHYPLHNQLVNLIKLFRLKTISDNWLLFDTISDICAVDYVVDSSKNYKRMAALHSYRPKDLYLIVLDRDIYGYAYSYLKLGVSPERSLAVKKVFYEKIDSIINHSNHLKHLYVKYENLCTDPVGQRKRIADFLGLPDPHQELIIDHSKYHIVAGNPMRYKQQFAITYDETWKRGLDNSQKKLIALIAKRLGLS